MRLLELFSGTQSVSRVARRQGWECVSLDIDPTYSPDLCMSVLDFDEQAYPRDQFAMIWASPPCESYSSANIRYSTDPGHGATMAKADELVRKTKRIMDHFSSAAWVIENPPGVQALAPRGRAGVGRSRAQGGILSIWLQVSQVDALTSFV